MKAAVYEAFQQPITIQTVPDPIPTPDGVVIEVKATGLCRSDWHGWMGHDPEITLPHVPGHELAGVVAAVGKEVQNWQIGDRVTLPFVCGCGRCHQCLTGNHQVCDYQFQPGFTHWGSFAEYVAIQYADVNLVRLPESVGFETAASLGCRFVTSFRAVVDQGKVQAGEWVAVHGWRRRGAICHHDCQLPRSQRHRHRYCRRQAGFCPPNGGCRYRECHQHAKSGQGSQNYHQRRRAPVD